MKNLLKEKEEHTYTTGSDIKKTTYVFGLSESTVRRYVADERKYQMNKRLKERKKQNQQLKQLTNQNTIKIDKQTSKSYTVRRYVADERKYQMNKRLKERKKQNQQLKQLTNQNTIKIDKQTSKS